MEKLLIINNKEMTRTKKYKKRDAHTPLSFPSHRFSKWKYIKKVSKTVDRRVTDVT